MEENRLKWCLKGGGVETVTPGGVWIRLSVTEVYLTEGERGCHEQNKNGHCPTKKNSILGITMKKINTWVGNNKYKKKVCHTDYVPEM
jgi:hypothetical protein